MVLEPIDIDRVKKIAAKKKLKPGRIKGTDVPQLTDGKNPNVELIDWAEFEKLLKKKNLNIEEIV